MLWISIEKDNDLLSIVKVITVLKHSMTTIIAYNSIDIEKESGYSLVIGEI